MRTLAIDFGTKRVGLAMSDEGGMFASPLDVWANGAELIERVAKLCKAEGVQQIVVGLPLNMDGSASWMSKVCIEVGGKLAGATAVPVLFVDERLSSFDAEQSLIERKRGGEKMTRLDKKSRLDALAAAGFLREFLEGRLSPIDVSGLAAPKR